MRFVVDECTGPRVAAWLASQGHDVLSIFAEDRGTRDREVLRLDDERARNKIARLQVCLAMFPGGIGQQFIVVTDGGVRVAGASPGRR